MDPNSIAFLLQTTDPLFPTGAYAHSLGLEEMVRLGVVSDEPTLRQFLKQYVLPDLERFELPFVRAAWEAASREQTTVLLELNTELSAWKLAAELRDASLQLGTRRLQMLLKIAATPLIKDFAAQCNCTAHHAIVCGIQGVDMPEDVVVTAYIYQALSGYCSAALKLIRIGQDGCQRVLRDCLSSISSAVHNSKIAHHEIGFFNPILEIASMRHKRATERLFIS